MPKRETTIFINTHTITIMTINETVERFVSFYEMNKQENENPNDFYCGITNDLNRRREEHNVSVYIATTRCDNFKTAQLLEQRLKERGFDTGKQTGNGLEDSVYVYIYHKIKGVTRE